MYHRHQLKDIMMCRVVLLRCRPGLPLAVALRLSVRYPDRARLGVLVHRDHRLVVAGASSGPGGCVRIAATTLLASRSVVSRDDRVAGRVDSEGA